MNMQMLVHIGLLYFATEMKLFISIALVLIIFQKKLKKNIRNKNIKANIFFFFLNNSVTCGYFCIELIDFMLAGKKLNDYTNLFSPHDFKKNDNIILSYLKNEWK